MRKRFMRTLSNKQHLAILGQGPQFIVNDKFQLVDMIANLLDKWSYGIVVGNGFLAYAFYLIGNTTGLDERFYILGNEAAVLADALYECQIVGADLQGRLFGEYLLYLMYIIY